MSSKEEVASQINLLRIHRRNIKAYLESSARYGLAIPTHIETALESERDSVNRIKNILRNWGLDVEDHEDDTAPVLEQIDNGKPHTVRIENDNTVKVLVLPNAVFAVFKMAMKRDYEIDITEFVVSE